MMVTMQRRRQFLNVGGRTTTLFAVGGWCGLAKANVAPTDQAAAPNILLILSDDQGWSQLSEALHPQVPEGCSRYMSTPSVTARAVAFMREQVGAGRPFYVQASYYAVHLSVVCREQTLQKYRQKGAPDRGYTQAWAAMLEELDAGIGALLQCLDDLGIADNTYVVFTADNGGRGTVPGGDAAGTPPNFPLTGAKHSLYEGGIRVPFLVRGPKVPSGGCCHQPVAGYDLLPTFYELAGGRAPLPKDVDGASLGPLLRDPQAGRVTREPDALIFHRPGREFSALRQGDYKLLLFWRPDGTVRSRELYRFDPDPREEGRDRAAEHPERADALQRLLLTYLKSVHAETPEAGRAEKAAKKKKAKKK